MSFGTYTEDDTCPLAMGEAVRLLREKGVVVVASAGNDATCRPAFPAAHPDVIAVGALDCHGPAAFTNHGRWVDACAPGVGVVSTFVFHDGPAGEACGADPDRFEGWARWSGTRSAPGGGGDRPGDDRLGVDAETAAQRPPSLRLPELGRSQLV